MSTVHVHHITGIHSCAYVKKSLFDTSKRMDGWMDGWVDWTLTLMI